MTATDRAPFQARIPRDLHEWLVAEAGRQNRSINAQLVHLIQRAKAGASK